MSELDHWWDRFTVASNVLVGAWTDLRVRGYDKEPNLIAASLDDIEGLVQELRKAGFGAEGDPAVGRAELIEAALEYGEHTCTCPYCVHAKVPTEIHDFLTRTIDPGTARE